MNSRLRVEFGGGTVEVEGSEEFVQSVYADLKPQLATSAVRERETKSGPRVASSGGRKRASEQRDSFQIVKDLNLVPKGKKSLRDFASAHAPKSNMEWNVLFVYYLQQILEIQQISIDHVFTCYRELKLPIPKALTQSLVDTSSRKGWLDTASLETIRLMIPGTNYVEHSLVRSEVE